MRRRLTVTAAAMAAILAAVAVGLAFVPWVLADPALQRALVRQIDRASGLTLSADGPITVRLLPRPTVQLGAVAIRGLDDAVALDAEVMRGRLDLAALLRGQLRVVAAIFERPTAVVELDRILPLLEAMHDRSTVLRLMQSGGLTVHGGVVRLHSSDSRHDALLTDVAGTFEWPADDAEGRLVGAATWRGITGQIAADLERPGALGDGGQTLASLRLKSAALDLDAHGSLQGGDAPRASGRIIAATGDLPAFLRLIGLPTPQLDAIHEAHLTAGATLAGDTLSLDDAALGLDDMLFEGALTVRQKGDRTSLAGTLASEHVDLDRFLDALPAFTRPDGAWTDAPLQTRSIADDDIDLRLSATTAKVRTFTIEDGSFSLQSGQGRMELSLGEAHAYDGLLKGRVVATTRGADTELHADVTLSRLDLERLFKDVPGGYAAAGILTGHLTIETQGAAPTDLARSLQGRGQLSLHSGALGDDLMAALIHPGPTASLTLPALAEGGIRLDAAALEIASDGAGRLTLKDSWVAFPAGRATIEGSASVPRQSLDLRAAVTTEEAPDADASFTITGPWQALRIEPERPRL